MLVYGDQQYDETPRPFLKRLQARFARTPLDDVDGWRTLLIQAGQLEQGLEDHASTHGPTPLNSAARHLTDHVADHFFRTWARGINASEPPTDSLAECRAKVGNALAECPLTHQPRLTLSIPEGYEFYALFPEQYCLSALRWANERRHATSREAQVVGLRSIGTSLSAIVAATLRSVGWKIHRFTVRPGGPPFARQVSLESNRHSPALPTLVVDEGPGLSGSSMAATARALAEAGTRDIAFLPGHGADPGPAASPDIRQIWARVPRYWTPFDQLQWQTRSLTGWLAHRTSEFSSKFLSQPQQLHEPEQFGIQDLSAGQWRRHVFQDEAHWPACSGTFERMKFHVALPATAPVLWKFVGFGCARPGCKTGPELTRDRLAWVASQAHTPRALDFFRGFIAVPWLEGRRLRPADAHQPEILTHLGRYLVRYSQTPLRTSERTAALERLAHMLYCNTREALGQACADQTAALHAALSDSEVVPAYSDGRMAPHEWVRSGSRIWKTDCTGHEWDHTVVGHQPLCWDVAGALVEWNLDLNSARPLLNPLQRAGIRVQTETLRFYCQAYSAFRLGMVSICKQQVNGDTSERARLEQAHARYGSSLRRFINGN